MTKISLLALLCLALTGCASSLTAFFNRSVVKDNIGDSVATVSLAADRRTVLVGLKGENAGRFCAEPPPDSATGLKTDLNTSLELKAKSDKFKAELEGKGGLNDKLETTVVVLADRTPALDAFRMGLYALCQFNLNGAVADADVKEVFNKLIQAYENTAKGAAKAATAP